jgi:hypothetical protein
VCRNPWVVIRFPRPAFLHVVETMSATSLWWYLFPSGLQKT